ncbi:MAG TPA: hypothetical protein VIG51_02355 [Candidatus Baltobacteraceae bacterium]|jgi:hypothetical protein
MMLRRRAWGAAIILGLAVTATIAPAVALTDHNAHFTAVRATSPPPPEADLSSPVWGTALKATGWYDFTTKAPAPLQTAGYLLYDDKNLYVGVYAQQAGTPIVAPQTVDNAGVLTDDHISFSFDTSGGGSRVYSFKVNPHGVHDETSSENARYAPPWTSLAKVLPNGDYVVVMVIPLSIIRAQSSPVQTWRFNFVRFVAGTNEEYTWAYDPTQTDVGSAQFWPTLNGIRIPVTAARPHPHADIYALGSAGGDSSQFQNGIGSFQSTKQRNVGLDLTYPFTNTLAFVGTINPDFSNVEQDQTTIAPQEFQRNLSEYRPFFAQGSSYINALPNVSINSPANALFYTPSIGIFDRGFKVEGTSGRGSIGALNTIGNSLYGGRLDDTAFGYGYRLPDNSFTAAVEGVLANHSGDARCAGATCSDDTYGVSLLASNPRNGALTVVRMASEHGTLVTAPGQSNDFLLTEGFQTARLSGGLLYRDVGPQYAPLDGFTLINDIRGTQGFVSYNGTGRGAIKSYNIGIVGDRFRDRSGQLREADYSGNVSVTFKNLLSVNYYPGTSFLASYDAPYPVYSGRHVFAYNQPTVQIGYKDGTPTPIDASYSLGSFGGAFVQQLSASTSQKLGRGVYSVSLEYDGTLARALAGVPAGNIFGFAPGYTLDSQWLRRISLTRSFGKDASLAIGYRAINGYGGFAIPGKDLAVSFHRRFRNQDELYLDFGTPASPKTLNRFIAKYVFHGGGAIGT